MCRRIQRRTPLLFLGLLVACGPAPDRAQRADAGGSLRPSDSSANRATQDSVQRHASTSQEDRSLLRPAEIPPAVRVTCDSAAAITREALALAVHREEGNFFDRSWGTPRTGCRLVAKGLFKELRNEAGPVAALDTSFVHHGWRQDLRYGADGPDGSDIGMRLRDMLCLVAGRWNGGDDEDPDTSSARADENQTYEAIIECARDIASNKDAGVPDSIWSIASSAGLDSIYAISLSMQSPPYLDGDFDGDGVMDAAVLVEHRSTGKLGVVIVHRGTRRVTILGAGTATPGPDDLGWIDAWDVFRKGSTIHLTIRDRPNTQLVADALWVGRRDSASAFFIWTGRRFVYESHKP